MLDTKGRITSTEFTIPQSMSPFTAYITLEIPYTDEYMEALEGLKDKDVRISISQWREKRSLNANKYFHLLSDKLADSMRMSKPKMKNYLLFHYGQKVRDDDGNLIGIKTNASEEDLISRTDIHMWYLKDSPEDGTPMYCLLEHSRFYDSRQMSILIDGTVDECKAQGIETMTPAELERLKALWGKDEEHIARS